MSDVTPTIARDFYRAAARFYRESPWLSVGSDEPIKIRSKQIEGGFRFAIVLGKKGKRKGLWLCDDWKTCVLIEQGRYEDIAGHLRYTAIHFGDRSEISHADLEKILRYGFEVVGPKAFPSVFRKEPESEFRSPTARELEILEACLWVIPDFLSRAKDREAEVHEYAFEATDGKMSLDLSWVSGQRMMVDRPQEPSG